MTEVSRISVAQIKADLPEVQYVRPRCPVCHTSLRLKATKTYTLEDNTVLRRSQCLECGAKVWVRAK